MTDRRVWLAWVVLVLAAVGVYWFVAGRFSTQSDGGTAALAEPVGGSSVTVASSSSKPRGAIKATSPQRREGSRRVMDGTVAVPQQYQFAGVERVQTGTDFDDWMSRFSDADQKILRAFDTRFYGVYQSRTAEDIAWMAAHGYPMPEDVLAAQFLSTAELRDMVEKGSLKAQFLLKDRQYTKFGLMKAEAESFTQFLEDNPQLQPEYQLLIFENELIEASSSPYKAFMDARRASFTVNDPMDLDIRVIGALYWAEALGDRAATDLVATYIRSSPDQFRRERRRAISSGALATYAHVMHELRKLPSAGCTDLFGAWAGDNPTGHFDQ